MLPIGVSYFNKRNATLLNSTIICNIHGIVWYITSKLTIYLVALLSITRTISLVFPFYKINKNIALASIVLYLIYLVIPATFPFWYQALYTYNKWDVRCGFYVRKEELWLLMWLLTYCLICKSGLVFSPGIE